MKKVFTFIICVLVGFSFNTNAQDTVSYYGFEEGTTFGPVGSNWNNTGKTWVHEIVTDDEANAHAGAGYFKAEVSEAPENHWDNQAVYQEIAIENNTSYRFSMWMKANPISADEPSINMTCGTYNGWKELTSKYETKITNEWKKYVLMVAVENTADLDLIDADGRYEDTIRFPMSYPIAGEYYCDDVTILKSTIAGVTFLDNIVAVNYGYSLDYTEGISTDAYTVNVDGVEATVNSAKMVLFITDTSASVDPIVYLTLDANIDDEAEVKVSFTGEEDIYYSAYSPVTTDFKAAAFTDEIGELDLSLTIPATSSVSDHKFQFSISPNPVVNEFSINSSNNITDVNIYDLSGKEMFQLKNQASNEIRVNISDYNAGIYMVKVKDANGNVSTKKIIK